MAAELITNLFGCQKEALQFLTGSLLLRFVLVLAAEMDNLLPRQALSGKQLPSLQPLGLARETRANTSHSTSKDNGSTLCFRTCTYIHLFAHIPTNEADAFRCTAESATVRTRFILLVDCKCLDCFLFFSIIDSLDVILKSTHVRYVDFNLTLKLSS